MKNTNRYIIATEVTDVSMYDESDLFGPDYDEHAVDKKNGMFFTDPRMATRVCERLNREAEETRLSGRWPTDIPNYLVREWDEYDDPAWPQAQADNGTPQVNAIK